MSAFELDLTNDTAETLEMGASVTPGWYKAVLEDVKDNPEKFRVELIFKITHGPSVNQHQTYWLGYPTHADDPAKAAQRVKMIARRLGIIGDDDFGKAKSVDFNEAIGTEVFLFVETTPSREAGKKDFTGIAYSGIYPLAHPLDKLPKHFPDDMKKFRTGGGGAATGQKTAGGGSGGAAQPAKPAAAARPSRKTVGVDDL